MNTNLDIDLRGLRCPLPVLRVKKALGEMKVGDVLRAWITDPAAVEDIPAFLKQAGHTLKEISPADEGGHYYYIVKNGAKPSSQ